MKVDKLGCSFGGTRFFMLYEGKSGIYKFDYCCKLPLMASREKDGGHDEILMLFLFH